MPALQGLLEKYSASDLQLALRRAGFDERSFVLLPPMSGHGLPHARVVFEILEVLVRQGWLVPGSDVTRRIFTALVELRPGLYRETSHVASNYFGLGLVSVEPDCDEPTAVRLKPGMLAGSQRLQLVETLQSMTVARSKLSESAPASEALRLKINAIARELHATGGVRRGQRVAGTILEDVIASGSFGTVWKSRTDRGEVRATKVFHLDKLSQGLMLARFRQSIEMLRMLGSDACSPDSIVRIHQVSEDGLAFSMGYAAHGTLEGIKKYEWSLATILDRFRKICEACQYTHEKGVIHRDIKPNNVLLDEDLQPVLIDFDISDATTSRIDYLGASTQGWLGTPMFGSPEQLRDARCANRQSDIFSLGRLLHFMLLRGRPLAMSSEQDSDLADLSTYPPTIVEIVRKATRYDPAHRHASVRDLLDELDRHQTGWASVRVTMLRTSRWVRTHRGVMGATIILAVLVIGLWRSLDMIERRRLQRTIDELQTVAAPVPRCPEPRPMSETTLLDAGRESWAVASDTHAVTVEPDEPEETPDDPAIRPLRAAVPAPVRTPRMAGESEPGPAAAPDASPPRAPAPRPASQALGGTRQRIEDECSRQVWPMLNFTISVRPRGDRFTVERHGSREAHPAVTCAMNVIQEARFDVLDFGDRERQMIFELINPDAPELDTHEYRDMRRHSYQGAQRRVIAGTATNPDEAARQYGRAQEANIRAAQAGARLARRIHGRPGLPHWQVHYAEVLRRTIEAYAQAHSDKEALIGARPTRNTFSDCSRDLEDAWRLAREGASALQNKPDLARFFTQRADEYAKYGDGGRQCAPDQ